MSEDQKKEVKPRLPVVDRLVGQASSGRWLLTVMAGASLMMLTFVYCKSIMLRPDVEPQVSGEALFSIISMVFIAYFQKKNGNGEHQDEEGA